MRSVAHIDNDLCKRLVHRYEHAGIAFDSSFIAKRFAKRLTEANPDILNRMMVVDINIAFCVNVQIELSVLREQIQHMIQERNIRLNLRNPCSIYLERELDIRFIRFAGYTR